MNTNFELLSGNLSRAQRQLEEIEKEIKKLNHAKAYYEQDLIKLHNAKILHQSTVNRLKKEVSSFQTKINL